LQGAVLRKGAPTTIRKDSSYVIGVLWAGRRSGQPIVDIALRQLLRQRGHDGSIAISNLLFVG
jgi:hypothetical protein